MGDDIGARVRAVPGLPEVVADLLGDGLGFGCVEDNDQAMEWALRAYRAGRQSIAAESMLLTVAKWIEADATPAADGQDGRDG